MISSSAAAGVSAQTSDLFRLLLETVKDYAIFIISPEGYVLTWSPGAEALKGYKREEIVGQHFSKFYLPEAVESGLPMRSWRSLTRKAAFQMKACESGKMAHRFGLRSP